MMNSNTVGVRDMGRKGKMVPKGNSQRYCYENEEQMWNNEQKKDEETRKSVKGKKSFVNGWSQLIHTNLGPLVSER